MHTHLCVYDVCMYVYIHICMYAYTAVYLFIEIMVSTKIAFFLQPRWGNVCPAPQGVF